MSWTRAMEAIYAQNQGFIYNRIINKQISGKEFSSDFINLYCLGYKNILNECMTRTI